MQSGNINQLQQSPYLHETIIKLIGETKALIDTNAELGVHQLSLKESLAIIMEPETKIETECVPEFHHKYIDVQWLLRGEETIGFGHIPATKIIDDQLAEKDLAFTDKIENEKFISLNVDDFAVFFPKELHRPVIATNHPQTIKKVVIKIPLTLLK